MIMARPATAEELLAWCHENHARVTFTSDGVTVLAKWRSVHGPSLAAAVESHQLASLVSAARKKRG